MIFLLALGLLEQTLVVNVQARKRKERSSR